MTEHDRQDQLLAASLAAMAGFVDATGFIATGGFFLSFMSGNSTRLGVGIASDGGHALFAGGIILLFVIGVMAGTLTGRVVARQRRPAVMLLLAVVLGLAAALAGAGQDGPAFLLTAMAMGIENTIFEADGNVRISLTFMTGNLVKIGQRLTLALTGGPRWDWLPFLALWSAMIGGAVAGALAWPTLGFQGLWVVSGAAVILAAWTARRGAA